MESVTIDTRILTFDTESIADANGVNTFRIGGIYDGENFEFALTVADFISIMCKKSSPDCVFYAHNTGFDIPLIFFDSPLPDYLEISNIFCIGNSLFLSFNYNGHEFHLFDSFSILPESLKSLCTSLDVETPKEEFNIQEWQNAGAPITETLIHYNYTDCKSLFQVIKKAFSLFAELGIHEIKKTIAATSFNYFQNQEYENDKILNYTGRLPSDIENEARMCYSGGRTEIFYQGETYHSNHYDFVSRYPSNQIIHSFPIFTDNWKKYTSDIDLFNPNIAGCLYVKCEIDENILVPPIAKKTKTGLEFPTGKFYTWILADEYRYYANESGVKITILHGHVLETEYEPYFSHVVEPIFNRRVKAKKDGLKALAFVLKILLNAYYGKFGMRRRFSKLVIGKPKNKEAILRSASIDMWEIPEAQTEDIKNTQINPYIAGIITAQARYHLWRVMKGIKESGEYIYYCDTDSVFFSGNVNDIPVFDGLIGSNAGQMGEEHDSKNDKFFFLGKKMWATTGEKGEELKFKGIKVFTHDENGKEKQLLFYSDYEKIMNGKELKLPLLKFEKFRSKSSRGEGILIKNMIKKLKNTNKKERMTNGFLKPLFLKEF